MEYPSKMIAKLALEEKPTAPKTSASKESTGKSKEDKLKPSDNDPRSATCEILKKIAKEEWDELSKIAKAHYQASPREVQDLAHEFFNSMDSDGNGKIDLPEFLELMRQEGYYQMRNPYFYNELDRDGNGTLDFWEVMTVYYIIKTGRPFCDSCKNFIPRTFFACVDCYNSRDSSFTLCLDCYKPTNCKHKETGHTLFLDNFTLLQTQRKSTQATKSICDKPTCNTNVEHRQYEPPNTTTAIVLAKRNKRKAAFQALHAALAIGHICASTSSCTVS